MARRCKQRHKDCIEDEELILMIGIGCFERQPIFNIENYQSKIITRSSFGLSNNKNCSHNSFGIALNINSCKFRKAFYSQRITNAFQNRPLLEECV